MGSLLPQPGEAPKFAQLYISDPHAELDGRMGNFGSLNMDTMHSLQTMLHACNPHARIYQTVVERLQGGAVELSLRFVNNRCTDLWRYNAPTVDKVGALMVGVDVDEAKHAKLSCVRVMDIFNASLPYTVHTHHYTMSFSSQMDAMNGMMTSH